MELPLKPDMFPFPSRSLITKTLQGLTSLINTQGHLINAARACIPALWKQECLSSVALWIRRVEDIKLMEDLTLSLKGMTY